MFQDERSFEDPALFYIERGELAITAKTDLNAVTLRPGRETGRPLEEGERATVVAGDTFYMRPGGVGDVLNTGLEDCELLAARYDTTRMIVD